MSTYSEMIEALESEVQQIADESTPDLLPDLLERHFNRGHCRKHGDYLIAYIYAQIALTKAKRNYFRNDPAFFHGSSFHMNPIESTYHASLASREKTRLVYRLTACTCWVPHR